MNDSHQVHIQIGDHEPQAITVHPDETIASILARFSDEHPEAEHELDLLVVFAEDSDEEISHDQKFCECHGHRPKILHCHRCKKIAVTVSYNGQECREFGPNAKIRRVIEWAKKKFQVDDKQKWVLRLDGNDGELLDPDTKLGKLANHSTCTLNLFLTVRCQIQG